MVGGDSCRMDMVIGRKMPQRSKRFSDPAPCRSVVRGSILWPSNRDRTVVKKREVSRPTQKPRSPKREAQSKPDQTTHWCSAALDAEYA